MFRGHKVRRFQKSTLYKVWSVFLALALIGSGALIPPSGAGAITVSEPVFPIVSSDEEGPQGIIPDLSPGKRVVERGQFSRTEDNGDGSLTTVLSAGRPMHFKDPASGAWKEFQNELRPTTAQGFTHENTANGFSARFDAPADVAAGRPVVRFATEAGTVSMVAVGARPSRADVAGARIAYKDAYPGLGELSYVLENERLKEDITLRSVPSDAASARFAFDLTLEGVTAVKKADNSIEFADSSGKVVFRMPRPFMTDSSGVPETEYSDAITVSLTEQPNGRLRLELAPDLGWLQDSKRVLPITIDPTIETVTYQPDGATGKDVHIFECCATQNTAGSTLIHVGKNSSGQHRQSIIQFPDLATLPQDSAITAAYLKLYADSGTNALSMEVYRQTAAWNEADATWGNQGANIGTDKQGSLTSTVPGWNQIYLSGLIRKFVRREIPDYGVRVISAGGANQSVPFHSSNSTDATKRPQLMVTYVPASRLGVDGMWTYTSQDYGGGNTSSVNVSTGNMVFTHSGGSIATRGFGVDLTHTYNSADPYGQTDYYDRPGAVWGEGWTFSQNIRLYDAGNGAMVFKDPSGGADRVFAKNTVSGTTQNYFNPLYYGMKLTKDLSNPPADPKKVYKLVPDSGGQTVHAQTMYFDGGGKLRLIEDSNDNYLTYTYDTDATNIADPNGRLTTITDVANRNTTFAYDGVGGRLSWITDMSGRGHSYEYNTAGNLVAIKHGLVWNPDGSKTWLQTTTFGYGVGHHLTSVTNPRGHRSVIDYTVLNQWDSNTAGWVTEGANTTVSWTNTKAFRGAGSLQLDLSGVTETSPGGVSRTFTTPGSWSAVQRELMAFAWVPTGTGLNARFLLTDSRDRTVTGPTVPMTGNNWTAVRMPDAHVDPAYKVKKVTVQFFPTGTTPYTNTVYLDHLLVKGVTDSLTDAKPTPYTIAQLDYNWNGKSTTASRPDTTGTLRSVRYTYNEFGQVTAATDPSNNTTSATYDDFLRLTAVSPSGAGGSYTYSYYPNSNEIRTYTGPLGTVSRQGVNTSLGELRYDVDERNEKRRTDNLDYVATISIYDSLGRLTSQQTNRYAVGTDLEPYANSTLDPSQRPLPTSLETLRKASYTYGVGGVITSTTDARNNTTNYSYDSLKGYLTEISAPAGNGEASRRVTTITRNPDGSAGSVLDPKGQRTTYDYDKLGRLRKINYGVVNGNPALGHSYTLDQNSNMVGMSEGRSCTTTNGVTTCTTVGSSSWTYDENNRQISESRTQNGATKNAGYSYFANGLMRTRTTLSDQTVSYTYDSAFRLVSQTDPNDGDRAITYQFDGRSRPTGFTYPSGTKQEGVYDAEGNLDLITLKDPTGMLLQKFDYDYGLVTTTNPDGSVTVAPGPDYWEGKIRSVTELDGSTTSYNYDDLGRLVGGTRTGTNPYTQSYSYDANSNRTTIVVNGVTTTATYDAANQLVSESVGQTITNHTYDRNGNLTGYGTNNLNYDARNRWTGGVVNGQSMNFEYDAQGRRVSRTVGSARADFWYDSTGMGLETGTVDAAYEHAPDGTPLSIRSAGTTHNYAIGSQGTVTGLVTTDGNLRSTYNYDPWGQATSTTGGVYNPFRYVGTYQDAATGLYQMGARYYRPESGQFTQVDPLPRQMLGERYAYTGGDPVNESDPSGLVVDGGGGGSDKCDLVVEVPINWFDDRMMGEGWMTCHRDKMSISVCIQWRGYYGWYNHSCAYDRGSFVYALTTSRCSELMRFYPAPIQTKAIAREYLGFGRVRTYRKESHDRYVYCDTTVT